MQMKKKTTPIIHKSRPNLFLLSLPLLASLYLIGVLANTPIDPIAGVFGAPPADRAPIILGLVIFAVAYVVFILFLFQESIKHYFLNSKLKKVN
jgi:hypothetical protein